MRVAPFLQYQKYSPLAMKFYTLYIIIAFFALQTCRAQTAAHGGTSSKSAQAHPDHERDDVKKIDIHHVGERLRKEILYQQGKATYYSHKAHGRKTANGERHNKNAMICAHKTLPFGTLIRVVNEKNKKETVVRVNDRGPYVKGMVIDLSIGAARELGMLDDGVVPVSLYILE